MDAVEAHGTGTRLGDPIELDALGRVYSADREDTRCCSLEKSSSEASDFSTLLRCDPGSLRCASVKSNLGHLECGAGGASLLKLCCVFAKRTLPQSLHARRPNAHVAWHSTTRVL